MRRDHGRRHSRRSPRPMYTPARGRRLSIAAGRHRQRVHTSPQSMHIPVHAQTAGSQDGQMQQHWHRLRRPTDIHYRWQSAGIANAHRQQHLHTSSRSTSNHAHAHTAMFRGGRVVQRLRSYLPKATPTCVRARGLLCGLRRPRLHRLDREGNPDLAPNAGERLMSRPARTEETQKVVTEVHRCVAPGLLGKITSAQVLMIWTDLK